MAHRRVIDCSWDEDTKVASVTLSSKWGTFTGYANPHDEDIDVAWVPGAFEIPLIASKMAKSRKYDAIICVGAVIRGSTSHYDYVCSEVSKGIAQVSLANDLPVMFGVLTTDTIEQAIERAGTKAGNKGFECAQGAIEMVNLIREIG